MWYTTPIAPWLAKGSLAKGLEKFVFQIQWCHDRSQNTPTYETPDAHYHFVFTVKYRKTLITRDIERAPTQLGQEIGYRYDFDIEQMGCDGNHIHILVSFPPKHAGSDFARIFKSITAIHLFKQFPVLKQNLWGGEFWSDGFYMATVSERGNWRTVEKYVRNQGKTKDISSQLRLFT